MLVYAFGFAFQLLLIPFQSVTIFGNEGDLCSASQHDRVGAHNLIAEISLGSPEFPMRLVVARHSEPSRQWRNGVWLTKPEVGEPRYLSDALGPRSKSTGNGLVASGYA